MRIRRILCQDFKAQVVLEVLSELKTAAALAGGRMQGSVEEVCMILSDV